VADYMIQSLADGHGLGYTHLYAQVNGSKPEELETVEALALLSDSYVPAITTTTFTSQQLSGTEIVYAVNADNENLARTAEEAVQHYYQQQLSENSLESSTSHPVVPAVVKSPPRAPVTVTLTSTVPGLENVSASSLFEQVRQQNPTIIPYGCGVRGCGAMFNENSELRAHVLTHPSLEVERSERPYRCAVNACDKAYKNLNGLEYHLKHAKGTCWHAVLAGTLAAASSANDLAGEAGDVSLEERTNFYIASAMKNEEVRPYPCPYENCTKRYKNQNGLSYHLIHGHNASASKKRSREDSPDDYPFDGKVHYRRNRKSSHL